ncbi:hypothetical protein OF829_15620 [Sphingomonas sp. LB-2]|uniref:hypothetical protein n=1 Tax=Sphingomonas caeni TaxID=2984949 RepID=UPI0022314994|nr:hypothetical protein [Sphingomonas caeni]MCW3848664.1 hypothetical protein [Sphingomonas caeni]
MRLLPFMAVAAALLAAAPAAATDWREISTATSAAGDSAYYLIDRDSIRREGDSAFATLYLIGGSLVLNADVEFDCASKRLRPTSGWLMEGDGPKETTGMEDWQEGIGGSHAILFDYVCQFDPKAEDAHKSYGAGDPVPTIRALLK